MGWRGLVLERCTNCDRITIDAQADRWRYHEDLQGDVHAFCHGCAASEFGPAPSAAPPSLVCPFCDGELHAQPRGGWVCEDHGLIVAPKIAARA